MNQTRFLLIRITHLDDAVGKSNFFACNSNPASAELFTGSDEAAEVAIKTLVHKNTDATMIK